MWSLAAHWEPMSCGIAQTVSVNYWGGWCLNHRLTKGLSLDRTFGGYMVQLLSSSGATQSHLPRTMTRWLLNISKVRDSTTSLGNLRQFSVSVKSVSWCSEGAWCISVCAQCLWFCQLNRLHVAACSEPSRRELIPEFHSTVQLNR